VGGSDPKKTLHQAAEKVNEILNAEEKK